ncbi:MAG: T9SS type B sorting domain-containing protein [Flavisolibacter sp.]
MVNVLTPLQCGQVNVTPSFDIPDTVCVNTPVTITNTSVNASSYYWNFCVADGNNVPVGENLGNPGGFLSQPVFVDLVEDNGNFYGFAVNHFPGGIVRLDFGNNLLNNPTPVFLGNPSGAMNAGYGNEGIQIVQANGSWYGIIVGGNPGSGSTPRLVIVKFGTSLNNPNPVAVNWGNIGNMLEPIDLHVFQENGNWYGFTVNAVNNTITRFNFSNSFENQPTGVNLGNVGGLSYPDGIFAINDNGFWRVFVTNGQNGNSSLSRLDFGNSLLNTPTGVNLGNIGGQFDASRDLTILNVCGQSLGFVVNTSNEIIKLNFSSLSTVPTVTNLGNLGNLDFPHSLSEIFRVGNDLYSLITNVSNNTITRLRFAGCSDANIPSSNIQNPSPVTYSSPGTYSITLMVDDGLPTQATTCRQVVVVPPPVHSPTLNLSICSGGSLKLGSAISSASYLWNTGSVADSIVITTPGTYWVESSRFGCSVRDSFIVSLSQATPLDFSYQQDMCNPKTIRFTSDVPPAQNFQWSFGDGQLNTASETPVITYNIFGVYDIKLKIVQANGCKDSVLKSVTVTNFFDNSIVHNSDTVICLGDSIFLSTAANFFNYCWNASSGTAPAILNAYVKPTTNTTYTLTSQVSGANLVTNGDFSAGNTAFTSDYTHSFPNATEGQYWIGANPSSWNSAMNNCGDHTNGSGNMMAVNGSPALGAKIWSQTFSVLPNTNYVFSTWLQSLGNVNAANLQFSINNVNLGNSIIASANACEWKEFSSRWNSGSSTSATITIINNNSLAGGNDFALDDIFFGTVSTRTDSFTVTLSGLCDSIQLTGPDKICSPSDTLTYSVYKAAGCLQNFIIEADPAFVEIVEQSSSVIRVLFKQNGNTTLKAFFANDCKQVIDSIEVNVKFSPVSINLGPDVTNCRDTIISLDAGNGFENYTWQNGNFTPVFVVQAPGNYHVMAQNLCGQVFRDSFTYVKSVTVPFAASPPAASVCAGDSVQFTASGGATYSWQPASNFSQPASAVTKARVNTSQDFTVFISDPVCERDTLIIIPVNATAAAAITLTKSNDVDCGNDSAVLIANGGVSYAWAPNLYISRNAFGQITVKPPQTITYYVSGRDQSGCEGKDSVTVAFKKEGEQTLHVPTAFTPNGDGLNDIFKPVFIGPASKYDFRVYNRWGQLIFRTNNPSQGWNGYHASKLQPSDVFVYYITAEGDCNGKIEKKGTFVLIK